jgi:hypothetical protein
MANSALKNKVRRVVLHIAGSIMFLSIPFLIGPERINNLSDIFQGRNLTREVFGFSLILGFFYVNYFLLIPSLYFNKRYIIYIVILIVFFLGVVKIPQIIVPILDQVHIDPGGFSGKPGPPGPHPANLFFMWSHNLFVFLAVCFFSLVRQSNYRLKQTEKEKLSSELQYLRAQINPHFLFNTLNSIYSLAIEKSEYTSTAVVKLSGMMRYVISETDHDFVSLEKEISYISDYIELQKIRIDSTTEVSFKTSGIESEKKIAPLILIPFIENAFKYGVSPEEKSRIYVRIDIFGNEISMNVENDKVYSPVDSEEKSGMGIENSKMRLQLLYPARHTLTIKENDHEFVVNLTIQLE